MANIDKLEIVAVDRTEGYNSLVRKRHENHTQRRYNDAVAFRLLAYINDTPGMNQTRLASILGVSPAFVSRLVNGKENPSVNTLAEYERKLKIRLVPDGHVTVSEETPMLFRKTFRKRLAFCNFLPYNKKSHETDQVFAF